MDPEAASRGDQQRFTGVVLIHGLGLIVRNGMLQQALNALSYWFNHQAELEMRPKGQGRLWIAPHLTDDPDPDQPASRAVVDVVAPGPVTSATVDLNSETSARLEFREVWWAESFGAPKIGQTIAWAQVQWREQAARLLVPIYRREQKEKSDYADSGGQENPPRQRTLQSLLWLYGLYQYAWKAVQW